VGDEDHLGVIAVGHPNPRGRHALADRVGDEELGALPAWWRAM